MQKIYKFEIFNLGNSKTIKLRELIKLIADKLGIKPKIQQFPVHPGDVPITYADISKSKEMFGYQPSTSIEKGVENFVRWYIIKRNLLDGD